MSLDLKNALDLANIRLRNIEKECGEKLDIIHAESKRADNGWLFFYNTEEFIITRNFSAALAGNGPIFVSDNGEVDQIPSYMDWQDLISKFK